MTNKLDKMADNSLRVLKEIECRWEISFKEKKHDTGHVCGTCGHKIMMPEPAKPTMAERFIVNLPTIPNAKDAEVARSIDVDLKWRGRNCIIFSDGTSVERSNKSDAWDIARSEK